MTRIERRLGIKIRTHANDASDAKRRKRWPLRPLASFAAACVHHVSCGRSQMENLCFASFPYLVFLSSCFVSFAQDAPHPPYPIWPIPREATFSDARLLLNDAVIVVPPGDERSQFPGRLLAELIADQFRAVIPVVTEKPANKTVMAVSINSAAGPPEGYTIRIDGQRAEIVGADYRGALYGVSSFIQLVHNWGHQSVAVRQASIRDWPFLPIRWVHVYMPGKEQLPFARRYMRDFLLRNKFNGMILEVGGGMRLDSRPEISVGWRRTVSEWYAYGETISKYWGGDSAGIANRFAASCHFGVGGGSYIEKEDLRRTGQVGGAITGWRSFPKSSLCRTPTTLQPRTGIWRKIPRWSGPIRTAPPIRTPIQILFDIMDEYLDVLKPERVHIGHDEWRAGALCPRCKGKDTGELYAEDV